LAAPEAAEDDIPEPSPVERGDEDEESEEEAPAPAAPRNNRRNPRVRAVNQAAPRPAVPEPDTDSFERRKPIEAAATKKAEKPRVDTSGVAIGVRVKHQQFGIGTVTKLDGERITVAFEIGQKVFVFPYAFDDGYLRI